VVTPIPKYQGETTEEPEGKELYQINAFCDMQAVL
jgi:hypothetical protein